MKHFIIFLLVLNVACNNKSINKTTAAIGKEQLDEHNFAKKLLDAGIDFTAEGSVPSLWRLTINYDDTVRFIADNGLTLKFGFNQLKKTNEADKIIYSGVVNAVTIFITVLNKPCTQVSKSDIFTKEVSFLYNTILYRGCGKNLANQLLEGKWILEKIGNEIVEEKEYIHPVVFNFSINKNSLTGNDGCNNFLGKIELWGKRIQFYEIEFSKKNCNKKNIKDIINKKITTQLVDYYFNNGKLYFYLIDDSVLVFKK